MKKLPLFFKIGCISVLGNSIIPHTFSMDNPIDQTKMIDWNTLNFKDPS